MSRRLRGFSATELWVNSPPVSSAAAPNRSQRLYVDRQPGCGCRSRGLNGTGRRSGGTLRGTWRPPQAPHRALNGSDRNTDRGCRASQQAGRRRQSWLTLRRTMTRKAWRLSGLESEKGPNGTKCGLEGSERSLSYHDTHGLPQRRYAPSWGNLTTGITEITQDVRGVKPAEKARCCSSPASRQHQG